MGIRMEQWENIYQHMEEIYEDLITDQRLRHFLMKALMMIKCLWI